MVGGGGKLCSGLGSRRRNGASKAFGGKDVLYNQPKADALHYQQMPLDCSSTLLVGFGGPMIVEIAKISSCIPLEKNPCSEL